MNWYKRAKNYGEIGHQGTEGMLWMCNPDGSDFQIEEGWSVSGHWDLTDTYDEDEDAAFEELDRKFRGRFDPGSRQISILAPAQWYYSVPNNIINFLLKRFGQNNELMLFDSTGGYIGSPIE
jgi:hypothetical protein